MKDAFKHYFTETFFAEDPAEFERFSQCLLARRPKTFRVNLLKTDLVSFAPSWLKRGLPMVKTMNPRVFSADGERVKLGLTPEHLGGHIYVQDLSASMSVEILSEGAIDERADLLILDMAASPGGKTTQLAEHYPNALIIANEFDKNRLAQLAENIERMGSDNIVVTNYSGSFFSMAGEVFDRILLDAPCSGEGIAHKAPESLEYWNQKNIKKIAAVQTRLLSTALDILAVGGVVLYSTCTLNEFENEGVVKAAVAGRTDAFRITYDHKFWPHREETGGFYIVRIEKLASTAGTSSQDRGHGSPHIADAGQKTLAALEKFYERYGVHAPNWRYLANENRILAVRENNKIDWVLDTWYAMRFGKRIGTMEEGEFIPDFTLLRDVQSTAKRYELDATQFEAVRTGEHLPMAEWAYENGEYIVATCEGISVGTLRANGPILENLISKSLKKR